MTIDDMKAKHERQEKALADIGEKWERIKELAYEIVEIGGQERWEPLVEMFSPLANMDGQFQADMIDEEIGHVWDVVGEQVSDIADAEWEERQEGRSLHALDMFRRRAQLAEF